METVIIEVKVLNDVMSKLATLPYQEVFHLISNVQNSVDKCSKPAEAVPAKEA